MQHQKKQPPRRHFFFRRSRRAGKPGHWPIFVSLSLFGVLAVAGMLLQCRPAAGAGRIGGGGSVGLGGPVGRPGARPKAPRAGGVDIFGYGDAFARALKAIGEISPDQFAKRHASKARYRKGLSWDPTTALYWDKFQAKYSTFQVNPKELATYKKHGFMVSKRLGGLSFGEIFYRVYTRNLPVFVSADSLLHAWHRSYDAVLEELEETYLMQSLDEILTGMANGVAAAKASYGRGVLKDSVQDADYFLAVARSLLAGKPVGTKLGQEAKVAKTLAAVAKLKLQRFKLFGAGRAMDFSQFKVRGHYANSKRLGRYFKAMMWLGRIDLRLVGQKRKQRDLRRQLGSAIVLHDLITKAGRFKQWAEFDRMIQTFVGPTDSMTFAQLGAVLKGHGVKGPAHIRSLSQLGKLQAAIAISPLGKQQIRSHLFASTPYGADQVTLPRSFTVMGQKFVIDSWALSKVVADDILWKRGKVQRRMPSGLDVAFSVLGNNQTVPLLHKRMKAAAGKGRRFRDGLNYQHNLAAVRKAIDSQQASAWTQNIYTHWLGTLRSLSAPTTDKKFPQVFRTKAYAMKTLNTQLASWAQLRHDTILYAKQSYTSMLTCQYPHGYVEPRPVFWGRFRDMVQAAAKLIRDSPYPSRSIGKVNLRALQKKHEAFFVAFASRLETLRSIAVKQAAQKPLNKADIVVLRNIIQIHRGSGMVRYNGWYPKLFYKGPKESGKADQIVADVHTDPPAPQIGDPGGVLHQGVGNVDLMLIAIENGKDRIVYAGPTMSHYEFATEGVKRLSDADWTKKLYSPKRPPRPEWTRSYLLP